LSEIAAVSPGKGDRAPLITVAMPIYNAGAYLRLAVISMIRQTFTDWELIIIDDGSTDGAVGSIQDLRDSRIRLLRDGSNRGLAARLNEAIDLARGRYLARMDHDDVSYPERLARQVAVLEQDTVIDLVAVRCVAIDADNELAGVLPCALAHKDICARPWQGFYLPHPTWMGRIEWFRRHRYATPGPFFCEDQELLLRSYRGSRFATVPEVLFAYRVRSRIDWLKSIRTRKTLAGVQLRHFLGERRFGFAILAVLAFAARIAVDSLNALLQSFSNAGIHRHRAGPVAAAEAARWRTVLDYLTSDRPAA
jgi:glycosyltransferase involved in cell wall biosynthesis